MLLQHQNHQALAQMRPEGRRAAARPAAAAASPLLCGGRPLLATHSRRSPLAPSASASAAPAAPEQSSSSSKAKTQPYPSPEAVARLRTQAPQDVEYAAIIVGAGMGGLTAAAKMCEHDLQGPVLVLERYLVPGGSSARYVREGYTFDVGSSMMFGMGDQGETNLITKALEAVGKRLESLPDPTQVHYHLPKSTPPSSPAGSQQDGNSNSSTNNEQRSYFPEGLEVRVWRDYEDFAKELEQRFPHESRGIRAFYGECWRVFNALNSLELKSLEEPRYLLGQFARDPLSCLTLASYLISNCGDVARKHINDPELLRFIDAECYIWSTVLAQDTPMVNAGMVFCDRHYGGINYPKGGVGKIGEAMAEGLEERFPFRVFGEEREGGGGASGDNTTRQWRRAEGALVLYKAQVTEILLEQDPEATAADGTAPGYRACGVRLADGREFRAKAVVSNATRWDTFEKMLLREGSGGGGGVSVANTPEAREMREAAAALEQEEKREKQNGGQGGARTAPAARAEGLPETEQAFRRRFRKAPSFVSIHAGVRADAVPKEADVHHIVIEDWRKMEDARGTLFVSVPTLLDPSLAPDGRHIVHAFTPDWIDSWSQLTDPAEYEREKQRVARDIFERLEKGLQWPGLAAAVEFLEVGTPRTHRRYLGRADGSYGPIPARRPSGMLSMPFSTTSVPGLYCAGDSTFPGQGVNAAAFSAMAAAWRVAVDQGAQPGWPLLDRAYNRLLAWGRSLT